MPLLNYSTTIDVYKTLGEIQGMLAKAGARSISIDYDDGQPTAVAFVVVTQAGPFRFHLPVKTEAVLKVLNRQYQGGKVPRRLVTKEQAGRVGWRIVREWLAAQLAIIETEMVKLEQVMLPYLEMDTGRTLFESFEERRLALPAVTEGDR